jgi:hypothetical protein
MANVSRSCRLLLFEKRRALGTQPVRPCSFVITSLIRLCNVTASAAEIRDAEARLREARGDVTRIADRIRAQQAVEQQHLERQNANEEARVRGVVAHMPF